MTATPQTASVTTARIIAAALTLGVITFWIVAWIISRGGTAPLAADTAIPPAVILLAWAALAVTGLGAALYLQRRAAGLADETRMSGRTAAGTNAQVQTQLIIAWALLEAPALLSAVALLLFGARTVMLTAIPLFLVGMALTFPRPEWFSGP